MPEELHGKQDFVELVRLYGEEVEEEVVQLINNNRNTDRKQRHSPEQ